MFVKVTSLLALVAAVAAQSLTINTPASVVQCQPAQITWTATNTPVFVSIIPGGQPGAAALQDFGQQTGSSLTWTVNIAAGTSITFQLRDSTGAVAYSAPTTIQSSSDSSCLGAGASTAPATSGAATSGAVTSGAATSAAVTSALSSASVASSSVVASASSVASSAVVSASSVAPSTTAPAATTTPRASSSAASVVSSRSASGAAASSTSTNAALPTAKVGLTGLLGLAAAVVMA
ncbi:hypothetical protein OPQ81_001854 [Rhizoctonia solani]|nr:hypothetical protein OPQ81_001854 [Rhizoctonia solani]